MIGVIGGTGLRKIDGLNITRESLVDTPYGKPSDKILVGKLEDRDVAFLARHGEGHTIPPHLINYRANIYALENLGVEAIYRCCDCRLNPFRNSTWVYCVASSGD